jgi:hypothetical protein
MGQLSYSTKTLGEIDVALQGAQPALWGHIVTFQLTARLTAADDEPASLDVAPVDIYMAGRWLGTATTQPGQGNLPQRQYASTEYAALRLFLEPALIRAIEDIRNGGGLSWRLHCSYRLRLRDVDTVLNDVQEISIPQGIWIPLLEQMGYQQTMLLEVPVPDGDRRPELAHAVALLKRSERLIAEGQYIEAVGMCRDVLEEMSRALKDEPEPDPSVQSLFQNTRQMTKAERLRPLRRAAKVVTHPARHRDDVAVAIDWSRIDALSIVSITAALIQELDAPGAS